MLLASTNLIGKVLIGSIRIYYYFSRIAFFWIVATSEIIQENFREFIHAVNYLASNKMQDGRREIGNSPPDILLYRADAAIYCSMIDCCLTTPPAVISTTIHHYFTISYHHIINSYQYTTINYHCANTNNHRTSTMTNVRVEHTHIRLGWARVQLVQCFTCARTWLLRMHSITWHIMTPRFTWCFQLLNRKVNGKKITYIRSWVQLDSALRLNCR